MVGAYIKIKNELGRLIRGVSLNIDLLDFCPLECPSCAVGSIGRRQPAFMSLDTFRNILDWGGRVRRVMMYVYSDPCMVKNLHEYIWECRSRGIDTWISTMLQDTRCDFGEVLRARPTEFRISFAGWEHMAYFQKGADPDKFNEKFDQVCSLPRHTDTTWTLCFHTYKTNIHELFKAKRLAEENQLKFVALPCIFMVGEKVVEGNYTKQDKKLISHLLETPEDAIADMHHDRGYCPMWKQITLDAKGNVYLCQLLYQDRFRLGHYTKLKKEEVLRMMKVHPFCWKCMQSGMHTYQLCYGDFTKYNDPVEVAEKRRRA